MKKRLMCLILGISLMLGMVTGLASSARAATKRQITRAIAVVFDNSGSMYGNYRWCRATYAMEVFAAMMNEGDTLMVYPMWPIQLGRSGSSMSTLTINGPDEASTIREIYTPSPWGTPFSTVQDAYNGLLRASADEKYLIVLTDGEGFTDGTTNSMASSYLDSFSRDVNVMFLGIDAKAFVPTVTDSSRQFYDRATSSEEVLKKLTQMCNRIFGRQELEVKGDSIEFDVSMDKIIVFVQGENIENVTLSGGTKLREYAPRYSEYGSEVDRSLQGMLVTYEDLDAGSYTISYTGNADSICVYYEPAVDLVIRLYNNDGMEVTTEDQLTAGTCRVEYGLVDKYGVPNDSELLGDQYFDLSFYVNGVEQTITDDGSGSFELELENGDTLDGDFTVRYLDDYTIHKTGVDFGWPTGGWTAQPRALQNVTIQVTGGSDRYGLSKLEQEAVYEVSVLYDGNILTGDDLDRTTLTAELSGGNAEANVRRTSTGYLVTVGYHGDALSTDCGEYSLQIQGTYTLDLTGESDVVTRDFSIYDDSTALGVALELAQDYYEIPKLDQSAPIYVNLTANGLPMDPQRFSGTTLTLDIPGLDFDVAADEANSRYIVTLKPGDVTPGVYTVVVSASGLDELGRSVSDQDTAKIELQPYPAWMRILFYILVTLLILLLIWLYLNTKILPKLIGVGSCTFVVDGEIVTGSAKCSYTGKNKRRGSLTISSPHYGANPVAKCGLTLELEAVSPRYTRSAARSAQVIAIRPTPASSTVSVQVGGTSLNRDPVSNKLVKAGSKADAPIAIKIGNKAKTAITAEVLDMNSGGEMTISLSVNLKFY